MKPIYEDRYPAPNADTGCLLVTAACVFALGALTGGFLVIWWLS